MVQDAVIIIMQGKWKQKASKWNTALLFLFPILVVICHVGISIAREFTCNVGITFVYVCW